MKNIGYKRHAFILPIAVFIFGLYILLGAPKAFAISGSDFHAGHIIDDSIFLNNGTMSSQEIQSFLNAKVPTCDTNGTQPSEYGGGTRAQYSATKGYYPPFTCLKDYTAAVPAMSADSYCSAISAVASRTAAQIIKTISDACQINPQVIIVLLQKEQGLVTDTWPWSVQYTAATGFSCPDTSACDPTYAGFFNQVYYGARQFKKYLANNGAPGAFWIGTYRIYYNPDASCGSSLVNIVNGATAALYDYTPYQPNQKALAGVSNTSAGGTVTCGAYGNRNFWWYFNTWFGSSLTSVLFKVSGSPTYYLDWGGYYYAIPSADILQAYGLSGIAPRTISALPTYDTKGPTLTRTAQFSGDGTFYLVDSGKKYGAPNWAVFGAYGYSVDPTIYPNTLSYLLGDGGGLHMVSRMPNGAIFLMSSGSRRGFPDGETYSTLSGPNDSGTTQTYAQQPLTNLSAEYLDGKTDGPPMLLDGKFITPAGSPAIYLYDNGKKYLFSAASYANWGGRTDYAFSPSAMDQIPDGGNAPILVASGSGSKYLADGGKKKLFSASAQTAWGLADGQFTTVSDRALARLAGSTASTLLTPGAGVYFVDAGQKHGIGGLSDFNSLGFSWANVDKVSDLSLSLLPKGPNIYAPGSLLRTPNGAVSVIDAGYKNLGVTSGDLFSRFGFSWNNVRNIGYAALNGYTTSNLQALLKNSADSKYYEVDNGVRHYVDTTAFGASQYDMSAWSFNTVSSDVINSVKSGVQLTRFIRTNSSPTVFYVENGQRRAISSEATLTSLGGSWSSVVYVSDEFMSQISRGPMI